MLVASIAVLAKKNMKIPDDKANSSDFVLELGDNNEILSKILIFLITVLLQRKK